jgi:hypothetical protein
MTMLIALMGIISFLSGCKIGEKDLYREALSNTSMMDQGIIKTDVSLQIDFAETDLKEQDIYELSKYKKFKVKSLLNFDQDNDYKHEIILLIAGSGWVNEVLKDEKDIWFKPPILNGYMNLRSSDYLNKLIPGVMLQDSLIQLFSQERDVITNAWLSLFATDEVTHKKARLMTLWGEEKVTHYTQSVPQAMIIKIISDALKNIDLWDQVEMGFLNYLDFELTTQVDTYINKEGILIKQEIHIAGKRKTYSTKLNTVEAFTLNEKEWRFYPIESFIMTVDIDFRELGKPQQVKVPEEVYDSIINEAMFYRLINGF